MTWVYKPMGNRWERIVEDNIQKEVDTERLREEARHWRETHSTLLKSANGRERL